MRVKYVDMKQQLYVLLLIGLCLCACSERSNDEFCGEWASKTKNDQYLLIYKDAGNYIVKADKNSRGSGDEKIEIASKAENKSLTTEDGSRIVYSELGNTIFYRGQEYIKLFSLEGEGVPSFIGGDRIEKIRQQYQAISELKGYKKKEKQDCLEFIISSGQHIDLVKHELMCGHGWQSEEYYFNNGDLVFFYGVSGHDEGLFSNTFTEVQTRVYFINQRPFKVKIDGVFVPVEANDSYLINANRLRETYGDAKATNELCQC